MASTLYANVHHNDEGSGTVSVFVFGTPGDQVEITSVGGFSDMAEIGADGSVSVIVPQSLAMSGTGINNDGLKIASDGEISAYISNRQTFSTDLTIIFEEASLGQDYVLASYGDDYQEQDGGQFSVQATQDGTAFTFTLPDGQAATVSLNAGETFKFSTVDNTGNSAFGVSVPDGFDLTGTLISSNRPVAVFSGHSLTNIGLGYADHIVEQMPAVSTLSQTYVVAEAFSSSGRGNNLVRVVAAEADTEVRIDGALVATLAAGEFHELTLSVSAQTVTTTKPALVAQYLQGATTAGEGDPAMSFVPGTDTWLTSYVVATPSGSEALAQNLVNLVVPTSAVSTVQINGVSVDESEFTEVAGTTLSVANLPVAPGVVRVEASENFQLSLFGFDSYDSFLTFGGASFASGLSNVPPNPNDDVFSVEERATVTGNLFDDNGSGEDEDLDNDVLVVTEINGAADNVGKTITFASGAQVVVAANGDITYTASRNSDLADGEIAEDSFTYTVSDGTASGQATVTISVSGINSSPIATDDSFQTDENTQITVSAAELLSNDSDPDGDLVPEISRVVSSQHGTAVLSTGDVVFTPDAGFSGTASFVYEITDATGLTSTATASVTVNEVVFGSDFEVVLPDDLSPGQSGQAQINYTGEADPSAPKNGDTLLFAVSSNGGLVADPLSGGFSDTAFVLARATDAGAFEAIDVSVKGSAGPRSSLGASAQLADMEAETQIAARVTALQPSFMEADVVARIEANLTTQFGATVGTLTTSLATYADRFASLGLNADSATAALAFAIEAAGDYGSLQERGKDGALGQGWSTLADIGLDIDGTSVQMRGLADLGALRALSVDASALYTVSNSAGRSVSLSGDALALAAPARPQFEQNIDGTFQTTSAFAGTLSATASGFSILTDDGETLFFDADGNFLQMQLADGQLITATHNGDMQITDLEGPNGASLAFARNADGTVQSVEDADGTTATFGYNADGFLETVTRPEGQSSFAYNADGDLTSATAPGAILAQFTYDAFGRLVSADYGAGAQTEAFAYDDAGGLTITDGAGRITQLDLLPGSTVGRVTDGVGSASEIIFDEEGSIAGVRAPDGTETLFEFDEQGRLTQITDANGAVLGFSYGESGDDPASFTDAGGGTRSFDYDAGGRITEATWPDGTSLEFSYDDQGNLTGSSNRRGDDVTYTYDARGRLLSESDSSAGPTSYIFDARGRLTSATNDQGTTSLAYDSADRVTQIDYPTGKSLFYTYNDAGLRASMSDGGDYNIFYDYDALGRLTGLRDEDSQIVSYEYDGAGNLLREENGNGTVSLFTYDDAGRLTRIENQAPDESINSFNAYTYDAAGQRVSNETQDGTWTYGYDAIGQLTSAEFASINPDIADKSVTYEYDAAGNRTRVVEDGVETLYTANALNQYTQVGDATFTYDADGNMTSRTDPSGTTTYTYDLDNRLTSVIEADGTVLEFDYDVFGNRVSKSVDGTETEYLVDPFGLGDVVSEFTGGSLSATYTHGLGLASAEIGGVEAWYDADAVGTVTTLTGALGAVENTYVFTPFGTEMSEVEALANDFEFNGTLGIQEDADNLAFMRERHYSDELGRFLSEDPIWIIPTNTNLYSFVSNEPIDAADPSGEIAPWLVAAGVGAAVGGVIDVGLQLANNGGDFGDIDLGSVAVSAAAGAALSGIGPTGGLLGRGSASAQKYGYNAPWPKWHPNAGDARFGWGLDKSGKFDVLRKVVDGAKKDYLPDLIKFPAGGNPLKDGLLFGGLGGALAATQLGAAEGDGRSDGDPHLVTFDGSGYSFQAVGEFTLAIGDGFEIQTRQAAINDSVSVNSATVMNIGENVVGLYADQDVPLVINGTPVILEQEETIAVGDGSVYRGNFGRGDELGNFDVYVVTDGQGNGFWTNVYFDANHLRPFVASDNVAGLLGNLNGDRSDDFQLRDGTVLPQPLAQTALYGAFADSWRITQEDSLFLYRDGETTESYTDRNFPTNLITLDDLDPDSRVAAEAVAIANGLIPGTFEFETTVLDVVLTGSEDFAVGVGGAPEFQAEGEEVEIIEVQINEAPTAVQDTASVDEDGSVEIDVLANDTDPEGDALTLLGGSDPNGGTVSVVNGQLLFAPAPDFNGDTTLSYDLTDAGGNTVTGSVAVTVSSVPDAPIAADDTAQTEQDQSITIDVLANDRDPDGDALSVSVASAENGAVSIIQGGEVSYSPNAGFVGVDTITYTIDDGTGRSDSAEVSVTVASAQAALVEIAPLNAVRNEGDSRATPYTFKLTRQGDTSTALTIAYEVLGTGVNPADGTDFVGSALPAGEIRFEPGQTSLVLILEVEGDTAIGDIPGESFTVQLSQISDPVEFVGDAASGIIVNDDGLAIAQSGSDLADVLTGSELNDTIDGLGGDDDISGFDGSDLLFGGAGDDLLHGGDGGDYLTGGPGRDVINGDAGIDTLVFSNDGSERATVNLSQSFGKDPFGDRDKVFGIENVIGTDRGDLLVGGAEGNRLEGADGDDNLVGKRGDDVLIGGNGADNLSGNNGDDVIIGDFAIPYTNVIPIDPEVSHDDRMQGGQGNDLLFGGEGADLIVGQIGDDALYGELGNDRLNGGNGIDLVSGGDGDDLVNGGADDDLLFGDDGDDRILGGNGDDRIEGGRGDDFMNGAAGADVFVFESGDTGSDTIRFYHDGVDRFDFTNSNVANFADLTFVQDGADALIMFDGNQIRLQGRSIEDLDESDFIFGG
ncbi:MAG: Ig-like domain-containing protein [Neomegalonema sp.]|nr:Ig-like domain-containing protein [Neomegalonema sp.]